ncbi:unnamed protein product [Closterium sp. NIES-64]|nr:unnamed protein product [Closterium sp. NIES-64]
MVGGIGICGIHSVPAIYPVIKTPSPCNDGINPCGWGDCAANTDGSSPPYVCSCADGFVPVTNNDGTPTCALDDVCSWFEGGNPCGVGSCLSDSEGGYLCLCPPGFKRGLRAGGTELCVPTAERPSNISYPMDVDCELVYQIYGLDEEQFLAQNPDLENDEGWCDMIWANTVVNVTLPPSAIICGLFYSWSSNDTCAAVADGFDLTVADLEALNPGVNCTGKIKKLPAVNQQVCVQEGNGADFPMCTQFYTVLPSDNCNTIMKRFKLSHLSFYALNPGLSCAALFPYLSGPDEDEDEGDQDGGSTLSGTQVCISGFTVNATGPAPARSLRTLHPQGTLQRTPKKLTGFRRLERPERPEKLERLENAWVAGETRLWEGHHHQQQQLQQLQLQQRQRQQQSWQQWMHELFTEMAALGPHRSRQKGLYKPGFKGASVALQKRLLATTKGRRARPRCLAYYSVQRGDFCARIISLKFQNISAASFPRLPPFPLPPHFPLSPIHTSPTLLFPSPDHAPPSCPRVSPPLFPSFLSPSPRPPPPLLPPFPPCLTLPLPLSPFRPPPSSSPPSAFLLPPWFLVLPPAVPNFALLQPRHLKSVSRNAGMGAVPSFALLQPRHLNRVSRYPSMGYDGGCDCWSVDLNVDWRDLEGVQGRMMAGRSMGYSSRCDCWSVDLNVDWRELQGVQGVRNEGCGVVRCAASSSLLLFVFACAAHFSPRSPCRSLSPMAEASWPIAAENAVGVRVTAAMIAILETGVMGDGSSERGGGDTMAMTEASWGMAAVSAVESRGVMEASWAIAAVNAVEVTMAMVADQLESYDSAFNISVQQQQQLQGQVVHISASADPPPSCTPPSSPSPLQVVDCEPSSSSCKGGWPTSALDYMVDASNDLGGLVPQLQYPYKGKQAKCNAGKISTSSTPLGLARYEQVDFYGWIGLLLAVQVQPVIAFVRGSFPSFQKYKWGVYGDPRCAAAGIVDHAVLVVGYAFTGPNGQGNWIVRNSWGTKWGEQGNWTLRNSWGIKWWGEQVRPYEDGFARSIGISPSPPFPNSPTPPLPFSRSPFPSRRPYEDGFRRKRWHLRNPFRAGYLPHRSGSPGGAALVSIRYSSNSLPSVPPSLPPTPSPHHPPPSATKPHQFRPPCLPPVTWPLTLWGRRKINSLPSVPPPLPPTPSPPSPSPINRRATPVPSPCDSPQKPCGGGVCVPEEGGYSCQCPAGFVSFTNDDGMQTCAPLDACGTQASNPCLTGTCINDNAGGYFCLCPPGYVKGSLTLGWDTCTPSTDPPTTLTFPVDVDCPLVYQLYGLTEEAFLAQNSELASPCATIPANTEVNVAPTSTCIACSLFYSWTNDDSCSAVAELFEIDETELTRLNPGLDCSGSESCHAPSPGQQICVREGDGMDYPMCSWWEGVKPGDTCATLMQRYNLPALSFFWMNPGLACDNLFPNGMDITGVQVCLFAYIYISTTSASYRSYSLTQPLLTQQHRTQPQPTAPPLPSTPHSLGKLTPQQSSSIQHPSPQQGLLHQSPWKRVWTAKHLTGKPPFQLPPWQQPAWQQRWARLVKAGVLRVGRAPVTKRRCLAFYSVTRGDFCARIISLKFQNRLNNGKAVIVDYMEGRRPWDR